MAKGERGKKSKVAPGEKEPRGEWRGTGSIKSRYVNRELIRLIQVRQNRTVGLVSLRALVVHIG